MAADSALAEIEGTFVPGWTFADKIRKARTVSGLDQRPFAERVGLTASTLAAYETGRSTPRFRDVTSLAKRIQVLTKIDYSWFLEFETAVPQPAPKDDTLDYRGVLSDLTDHPRWNWAEAATAELA